MSPPAPAVLASDSVHSRLRAEILEGKLAPGDALPSERILAEEHSINRHAVREALKRLQQAGLIRISQGGATRVLDWRDSGGLEVLLDLMSAPGEPPASLMRSVLEMRESIGVDSARRFAERAGADARSRAAELAEETAAAIESARADALGRYVGLWQAIVDGSGNLAYRLALNTLNGALEAYPDLAGSLTPRDPDEVRTLGVTLATGDGDAAARAAGRLLTRDVDGAS